MSHISVSLCMQLSHWLTANINRVIVIAMSSEASLLQKYIKSNARAHMATSKMKAVASSVIVESKTQMELLQKTTSTSEEDSAILKEVIEKLKSSCSCVGCGHLLASDANVDDPHKMHIPYCGHAFCHACVLQMNTGMESASCHICQAPLQHVVESILNPKKNEEKAEPKPQTGGATARFADCCIICTRPTRSRHTSSLIAS